MSNGLSTLSYAVRLPVIAKYTGQLLFLLSMLTLIPLIASLSLGDNAMAGNYLIIIALLLVISIPLLRLPIPAQIQTNEALVIVALAFILIPFIMTYPLTASGLSFEDALFEAVSAVTTTGLSTVTHLQDRPPTFLFARAWMQWYGGLGIVVLSVALLMGHNLAARHLSVPLAHDTLATTARTHARRMLAVYLILTILGFVLLFVITGSSFNALLHVLTAVSTGGFAPHDSSLAAFDGSGERYAIILLSFCGAIPLPLYYLAWRQKNLGDLYRDPEFRALLTLILIMSFLLVSFLFMFSGLNLKESFNHGILLAISAQTTTGFSSLDMVTLDESSKFITIIAMLIGGGVGSTAGGIKVLRLLIVLRLIHLLIKRTAIPIHAVVSPMLGEKKLENNDIQYAMLLILLFCAVVLISWLIFLLYGYPPVDALFEVVSATGTVGLSTGITHTELPALLKTLLCLDMLLGRVEIVALLIVLYPPTWIGKRTHSL